MPKFDIIASVTLQLKYTVETFPEGEEDGDGYYLENPNDASEVADAIKADLEDDQRLDEIMSAEGFTISNVSLSAHASK